MRVNLDPPYELSVIGQVEEAGLFLPHLRLTATYTTVPGSNRLVIHDVVENRSAGPAEMQLLYHCNLGPPFLEAGSRVVAPIREMAPLTARAAEGIDTFDTYAGPHAGFAEQVYCYDLLADAGGQTLALLYNAAADRGLALRFNRNELPCFTVWKNTAAVEDGYVTGLEPATNYPESSRASSGSRAGCGCCRRAAAGSAAGAWRSWTAPRPWRAAGGDRHLAGARAGGHPPHAAAAFFARVLI